MRPCSKSKFAACRVLAGSTVSWFPLLFRRKLTLRRSMNAFMTSATSCEFVRMLMPSGLGCRSPGSPCPLLAHMRSGQHRWLGRRPLRALQGSATEMRTLKIVSNVRQEISSIPRQASPRRSTRDVELMPRGRGRSRDFAIMFGSHQAQEKPRFASPTGRQAIWKRGSDCWLCARPTRHCQGQPEFDPAFSSFDMTELRLKLAGFCRTRKFYR